MSCLSCGGCFTGTGCSTSKSTLKRQPDLIARFQSLLDLASSTSTKATNNLDHDHIIPTIISELSNQVYSSQIVLFKAYDELSLEVFLNMAKLLNDHGVVGMHIAWAAEYCQNDLHQLLNILSNKEMEQKKKSLLQHCNDQAEIHEMFAQLPTRSVGRTFIEEKK
ncbi:uncharacterized protein BX663DRAFT_492268 [Cokeromyces recurvatus]|uniref:uncharacterized protein n=1 Tax=Cokeromyces recurvatus TaxID=90255 RepID=UPI0022204AAC|nr:uncharacterized protein BX663DRAFT_492268 [Cokeromyces recurvatus]KAI7907865.1 hypothetical protein BX663DRAFT_492268 [Cokeromyces recurvatus]